MLKERLISAVVLALVFFALPWLPSTGFALVMASVVLVAAWEWSRLLAKTTHIPNARLQFIYLPIVFGGMVFIQAMPVQTVLLTAAVWWLLAACMVFGYPQLLPNLRRNVVVLGVAGVFILLPAWKALIELQGLDAGTGLTVYFLALVWVADSAAYFAGRKWGKTKLAAQVSPGKSWQGVYAALLSSCILSALGAVYFGFQDAFLWFILIGVLTVAVSIFGDLVESMVKRDAGVKDSSALIPGHGGVLDRIDSMCAAAPVFVLCLGWLKVGQ